MRIYLIPGIFRTFDGDLETAVCGIVVGRRYDEVNYINFLIDTVPVLDVRKTVDRLIRGEVPCSLTDFDRKQPLRFVSFSQRTRIQTCLTLMSVFRKEIMRSAVVFRRKPFLSLYRDLCGRNYKYFALLRSKGIIPVFIDYKIRVFIGKRNDYIIAARLYRNNTGTECLSSVFIIGINPFDRIIVDRIGGNREW